MAMKLSSVLERLRDSLFFVPMVYVVGGLLLGVLGVEVDRQIVDTNRELPFGLTSTVDSARAVLQTVGSATITFAGIAFSISLLVIQLASSQYSPRVVHGLLRDPFTKRVMGTVVGTFTYCLVVLRAVRGPLEESGDPVIPNVSVGLAVLLGVVAIMAIIAFIDHSAHSMDVSRILSRATGDAASAARRLWAEEPAAGSDPSELPEPGTDALVITHVADGWVKDIRFDAVLATAPPGGTVRLETEIGRYAVAGTPLCTVWPTPDDQDEACRRAREAMVTGRSRTVERDVGYGVRQLADVALRALSPGINDPTTAQDAIFHLGSVLHELLIRHPPRLVSHDDEDRTLLRPERQGHVDVIGVAFDEVRLAATGMPTVCIYLLEVLHLLRDSLPDGPSTLARDEIRRQAALIRASVDHADLGAHDADRIRRAHDRRFGPPTEHLSA
jgi:uncharacterized membrane protein